MRARCTKNPDHQRFATTAHVMEEWEVTSDGDFVSVIESLQIDHGPDPENEWTCLECGAKAEVTQ
jgi:hypothetical protein